ncbi:MAG: hypothetical protein WBL40_13455 [Terrimicrobiaceae bacterium]
MKTVTDEASFGSQMETRRVDCVEVAMSGDGFDGVVALAVRSSETQALASSRRAQRPLEAAIRGQVSSIGANGIGWKRATRKGKPALRAKFTG